MGYILIEVIEREITMYKYDTLKQAQDAMAVFLCEALGVDTVSAIDEQGDFDCEFLEMSAWANTNHPGNCDWKIEKL